MELKVNSANSIIRETISQNRPILSNLDANLFPNNDFVSRDLVEISGAENCGKTRLLQYLVAYSVVSNHINKDAIDVFFIDLEHKFDLRNFTRQLEYLFKAAGVEEEEAKDLAVLVLHHITVVNYYTAEELECGLLSIDQALSDNKRIALLAIDGLDAFYWLQSRRQLIRMNTYYARLTAMLQKVCSQNNICCAYSVDSNFLEEKSSKPFKNPNSIRFKLKISTDPKNGQLLLNGKPFHIDMNGVHFK